MVRTVRRNVSKARTATVDLGEFRQFAFLAIALMLEFTTMVAG